MPADFSWLYVWAAPMGLGAAPFPGRSEVCRSVPVPSNSDAPIHSGNAKRRPQMQWHPWKNMNISHTKEVELVANILL